MRWLLHLHYQYLHLLGNTNHWVCSCTSFYNNKNQNTKIIFIIFKGETYPEILLELAPLCKQYAEVGTPKQAKQAIRLIYFLNYYNVIIVFYLLFVIYYLLYFRCMYVNKTEKPIEYFTEILEVIKNSLVPGHPNYRTAIVSLGHIAYNLPQKFPIVIKNIVSRKVMYCKINFMQFKLDFHLIKVFYRLLKNYL